MTNQRVGYSTDSVLHPFVVQEECISCCAKLRRGGAFIETDVAEERSETAKARRSASCAV